MGDSPDYGSKLEAFKSHILPTRSVLIATHDYPDPDCLASAFGMGHLLTFWGVDNWVITHGGFVGRAENRAMIRVLDIKTTPFGLIDLNGFDKIILLDALPGGGNVSMPESVNVDAVFDHHSEPQNLGASCFQDVRPALGATSTLVSLYLFEAKCPISLKLATGLYYGIKTDTHDMAVEVLAEDLEVYRRLFEIMDHRLLALIEHPQRDLDFFHVLHRASETFLYGSKVGRIYLGRVNTPDHVAEMADLFHTLDQVECTVCCALFEESLFFSVRTKKNQNAGALARKVAQGCGGSGGGHGQAAAGKIPAPKGREDESFQLFKQKLSKHVGVQESELTPLVGK